MSTIILTGGGSAGHCTPHLAILPYLKKYFDKIYYIGSVNGIEKDIINKTDIPYFNITCAKLNRKFTLKNFLIPIRVIKGMREAGKIIDELKPDVIFSKGGYVSVPTVIAANKRKIPVISHESDVTAGIANKIIAKYSIKVLTTFPETAFDFKNGEYVGAPIRNLNTNKTKQEILTKYGFSGKKPVLLVMGGSLGAVAINNAVYDAINELTDKFDVLHICGKGNVNKRINKDGYYQTEFIDSVEDAYKITDVCVSRAGSNAVFELLSIKKPCVFIPLPKGASRGDQILNAEYFKKKGLCILLEQEKLSAKSLILSVNHAYNSRKTLEKNFEHFPINDSSEKIALILKNATKEQSVRRRL